MKMIECKRCGRTKRHMAHGLCGSCYGMEYEKARRIGCVGCGKLVDRNNKMRMCITCANKHRKPLAWGYTYQLL